MGGYIFAETRKNVMPLNRAQMRRIIYSCFMVRQKTAKRAGYSVAYPARFAVDPGNRNFDDNYTFADF